MIHRDIIENYIKKQNIKPIVIDTGSRTSRSKSSIANIDQLVNRGHKRQCRACKTKNNLTVDHIIPLDKGGRNNIMNKQILCSKCNGIKGNEMPGKNGWWPDDLERMLK